MEFSAPTDRSEVKARQQLGLVEAGKSEETGDELGIVEAPGLERQ